MNEPVKNLKIVLIDDNFAMRYILRVFMRHVARRRNFDFQVYTSADGVQGLGYLFAVRPDIIIVDTTLPKYSGREIIDFIATNNAYNAPGKHIIVLHDGRAPLSLPESYTVISKNSLSFVRELFSKILDILEQTQGSPVLPMPQSRFIGLGGTLALWAANKGDRLIETARRSNIVKRLAFSALWLALQIFISVVLTVMRVLVKDLKEENLKQYSADTREFRVRYYPTVVTVFVALLLTLIQVIAYIAGGVAIFHIADRITPVSADFTNGYKYRRAITLDHTKVSGGANLSSFPVVFNGTYSYLATVANGGKVQNSNGYDIIFTSDSAGSTKLDHQIEKYDATTGQTVMWVRIPTLGYASDTTIYLFYGNSSISTSQENKTGVWDSNYKLVMHLNENTTASNGYKDSTSNANNSSIVTIDGTGSNTNATGEIGTAVQFDGSNDKIAVADANSLDITSSFTVSAWVKYDTLPANLKAISPVAKTGDITSSAADTDLNYGLALDQGLNGSGYWLSGGFEDSSHTTRNVKYNNTPSTATWYYVVGTFDDAGDSITLYRNGTQVGISTGVTQTPAVNNKDVYIGVDNAANLSAFSAYFDGTIDEVRISATNRSAGWSTTEYNNQNSPSTFYSLAAEETSADANVSSSGTQTSYIAVSTTNQYVGGQFIVQPVSGTITVTGVTLAEQGTVNAQTGLANIKLYYELDTSAPYDCASESYGGSESQFGSTASSFNAANGTAAFTGSVAVTTSQAMCMYTVLDVTGSASRAETIEIQITNPSTDVVLSASKIANPATAVTITGTTTIGSAPAFTVGTSGTQTSSLDVGAGQYIGGLFSATNSGNTANLTGITIAEQGTVNAQTGLSNVKLYYDIDTTAPYDCASESYGGSESQFGSTGSFNGSNGNVSFTGSVSLSLTQALCFYTVLDVGSSTTNGQTIEIQITNPSTDVTASTGSVSPGTAVAISGSTSIHNPSTSITIRANATSDNAFDIAGDSTLYTDSAMKLGGKDISGNLITAGTRFNNITVPRGATINSAKLDFYEDWGGNYSTTVKIKVYAEAADNASTYTTGALPRSRSVTSANVSWNSNGTLVSQGSLYSTSGTAPPPEMASLLQEVTDRSGWSSGNSVSFIFKDNGTTNDWWFAPRSYAYNGATSAPYLYITYTTPTVTASVNGTQTGSVNAGDTSQYLGGKFALQPADASATVTGVTIAEQGTVNAQTNLSNIKLYYELDTSAPYDCASESYAGTESQFGSTTSFNAANGSASFTSSVAVTTTQALCLYPVADIGSGAGNGDTIELQITNPSTDVSLLTGTVTPSSAVAISGTTTISVPNSAPTVTSVSVNGGSNISLTENTTTNISVTATVTDTNGYADISSVSGRLYRSGVSGAQACTLDDNNCYQQTGYNLTGCSGNSCTATLTFAVQFFAEPTDSGSPNSAEYWLGWVQATDASAATGSAFSPSSVTEMNTLRALNVQTTVSYGSLLPGNNTGATNTTTTITNTGNSVIDVEVSGSQLCTDYPTCSGGGIAIGNQHYSLSAFTYPAGTALTSTPTWANINISKPTAAPSNSTADLYWGLGLPSPLPAGSYTGSITISAITDQ